MILVHVLSQQTSSTGGGFAVFMMMMLFFFLGFIVPLAVTWQIFEKAGQPGWAALVPIYNTVVFLKIVQRPIWWLALLCIPFANLIVSLILMHDLARVFGKGIGFTVGLILLSPIFALILAFGPARYQGDGDIATALEARPAAVPPPPAALPVASSAGQQSTMGTPLEIAGAAIAVVLLFVMIGTLFGVLNARNSQSATPATDSAIQAGAPATDSHEPVAAPVTHVDISGPLPTPITADTLMVEEPVVRGTFATGEQISDTLDDLFVAHDWLLSGAAGQHVTLRCDPLNGDSTDPVITLIAPDGHVLADDDDGGGGSSALISAAELPVTGIYTVRITGWELGSYRLSVE